MSWLDFLRSIGLPEHKVHEAAEAVGAALDRTLGENSPETA